MVTFAITTTKIETGEHTHDMYIHTHTHTHTYTIREPGDSCLDYCSRPNYLRARTGFCINDGGTKRVRERVKERGEGEREQDHIYLEAG